MPTQPWVRSDRPLILLIGLLLLGDCGGAAQDMRPDPPDPVSEIGQLDQGEDRHVIAAWTADTAIFGEAAQVPAPVGRDPWPALYRVPIAGGPRELIARQVYNLSVRSPLSAVPAPSALLVYQVPLVEGPQHLRSTGRLFAVRPGEQPREIATADPPMVLQPARLSPDNRYVITYGSVGNDFWTLVLTDLQTGDTRRLGVALAVPPPGWIGFEGTGRRYVGFLNVEGLRPSAIYRLDEAAQPLPLQGRAVGLLPDGRVLTEGAELRAVVPERGGAQETLAPGPVQSFSTLIRAGAVYYVAAGMGEQGPLHRLVPGQARETVLPAVSYLWYAPRSGTVAYFAEFPQAEGLNLLSFTLPRGPSLLVTDEAVVGYKVGHGDGIFFFTSGGKGANYFAPGMSRAAVLGNRAGAVWTIGERHAAVLEGGQAPAGPGVLRVVALASPGAPAGAVLAEGVDYVDGVGRGDGGVVVYSVPKGEKAGIWRRSFP